MPTDSVSQLNCSNSSASQLNDSVASSVTSIQFDTFGPEDRFVHDGRQYVRASKVQIPNKTNRKASKSSSIWEFNSSHQHANGSEWLRLKDHTLHWRCEHCIRKRKRTEVYSTSTTSHPRKHLCTEHGVNEKSGQIEGRKTLTVLGQQQRVSPFSTGLMTSIDFHRIRELLLKWIVTMHISFSMVENSNFRALLGACSSLVLSAIPLDGDTIRAWIMEDFITTREKVSKELLASKSLIHISFDLWTSPNQLAMIGVIGHWMNPYGNIRTTLLGLRRLRGPHSGENMAQQVISVLNDFQIKDNLGYFVLDNATSNDTCVKAILEELRPDLNPQHRRLRCLGHIINLAAKAFVFGTDADAFEMEADGLRALADEAKELNLWRKKGPVGKLHNVIKFIRRSPQRREEFANIAATAEAEKEFEHLQTVADNATRWNSTFELIDRALKLRSKIEFFCMQHRDLSKRKQVL